MKKNKNNLTYDFYSLITHRKIEVISNGITFAQNKPVNLGEGFFLSIQASEFHYCDPTESYEDLKKYEAFEVGLMRHFPDTGSHGVFIFTDNITLNNYSTENSYLFEELEELGKIPYGAYAYYDSSVVVATFVSPEIVQSMVDEINKIVRKIRSRTVIFEKFIKKPLSRY